MGKALKFAILTLGTGFVASACAHDVDAAGQGDPPAVYQTKIDLPKAEPFEAGDLFVPQVGTDEASEDGADLLQVEQLDTSTTGEGGYAFDDVQGDHPCDGEDQGTPECRAVSEALERSVADDSRGSGRSAEAELQTLTNEVIDPETFDPERTIDEIGRGGTRLQSQAAQALGSEFLMPPPLEALPEDPAVPDPSNPAAGLPPVVLDITVTQN